MSASVLLTLDMSLLGDNVPTIRRIQRGARPSVAAKLAELTDAVVSHPNQETTWWWMIRFLKVAGQGPRKMGSTHKAP
ncbi:hypothetical protein GJ496_009058 [Pomphorhynchus laevis]|nr:hypothetical protein GJ496_009058 [Pomphorhynchus laevis]